MATHNHTYHTKSPVLFLIYNRPLLTKQVFEQIKIAKPTRLYVAADGPRPHKPGDDALCRETRDIIKSVDWECEVKTLFRTENGGCKEAVSAAVTWFFDHEEEGIILEDDCLPANSFFYFCDTLLEKYRYDTRIRHITGSNQQQGRKWGNASYYFSDITYVWGWAGWRRVWNDYDKDLLGYDEEEGKRHLSEIFNDDLVTKQWLKNFMEQKAGKIDSWAWPLTFINFFNSGLCIIPNQNLVSNLGFGEDATHTMNKASLQGNVPVAQITDITHPVFIFAEKKADLFSIGYEFGVDEIRRKNNLLRRRFKRWLKGLFVKKH